MTSKLSSERQSSSGVSIYRHDFKQVLWQNLVIPILGLIAFIILIPVSTAGIPDRSIFNIEYTHQQILFQFFDRDINALINAAVVLYGVVLGICLYRFMLVKRIANAYFSLGITRRKLFLIRYAAGLIMLTFALVIPCIASLVLNLVALGSSPTLTSCFIHVTLGFLLLGLISFNLTALVCTFIGTLAEAAAYTAVLLGTPTFLLFSLNSLIKHMLFGNAFGATASTGTLEVAPNFVSLLSYFNPLLFFYKDSYSFSLNYIRTDGTILPPLNPWLLVGWLITSLLITLLSLYVLDKRRGEIAGVGGQSRVLNHVLIFVLSFLSFALVVDLAAGISLTAALIMAAMTFIILYVALDLIITRTPQKLFKGLYRLPVYLGIIFVIVAVCLTGGFGYAHRVPSPDQVASVEMTYVGSPNYLSAQIGGTSDGKGYYLTSRYSFSSEQDMQTVTSLHKKIIAAGAGALTIKEPFAQTSIPYDIIVKYTMKDGSTLTRYYDRTTLSTLAAMLDLENTDTVKKTVQETILGTGSAQQSIYWAPGAYKLGSVYLSDSWYVNPQLLQLGADKRAEFLQCISKDVAAQSLQERYFPSKAPLGVIMFSQDGGGNNLTFSYTMENALVFVTPSFKNTLAFLQKYDLDQYFNFTGEIESITLQKYNPFTGISKSYKPMSQYFIGYTESTNHRFIGGNKDFGKDYVVKDAKKIAQIASLLRNDYFMSDGGYFAAAKIKGKDQYVYKFLPYTDAPDFVQKSMK